MTARPEAFACFTSTYASALGEIVLYERNAALEGLWFAGQKRFGRGMQARVEVFETPLLSRVKFWLDAYFAGRNPAVNFPVRLVSTPFRESVWRVLRTIPYGSTATYGEIASRVAPGASQVLARAVGQAVGANPVCIVVPCHRVVGARRTLAGYAGGIDRKAALLRLEGLDY